MILPDYPQHAVLGYIPSQNHEKIRKEYFKIKCQGFFFHDKIYKTIEELVIFFKKNFQSKSYRKYVESKKRKVPGFRVVTDIDQEPEDKRNYNTGREVNQVSEWEGDTGVNQTPFPAKTNYVGEVCQSEWNMSSHPGAQFSAHEKGGESGWGDDTATKKEVTVKDESGWGNNNDNKSSGWGDDNKTSGWGEDKKASGGGNSWGNSGGDNSWGGGGDNSFGQSSRGRGRGDRDNNRGGGDRSCFK